MMYEPSSNPTGRGPAYGKVCPPGSGLGRFEGNTLHGHGRFGKCGVLAHPPLAAQ